MKFSELSEKNRNNIIALSKNLAGMTFEKVSAMDWDLPELKRYLAGQKMDPIPAAAGPICEHPYSKIWRWLFENKFHHSEFDL